MGTTSPEERAIEEFLVARPSWLRKCLLGDFALTLEEQSHLAESNWPEIYGQVRDEYLKLLGRCPEKLREYRRREAKRSMDSALRGVPSLPIGAGRKDWLALEARELQKAGMSQPEIAAELNKRHPNLTDRKGNPRPITADVVRHQLRSLRRRSAPEKI